MDLYLFNTVINTIWYVCTILFFLYRFTSFFSYVYGFLRFCGKLWLGVVYVFDQIRLYLRRRQGYYSFEEDTIEEQLLPEQSQRQKTVFQMIKDSFHKTGKKVYSFFFGSVKQTVSIPMYQTQTESYFKTSLNKKPTVSAEYSNSHVQEARLFEENMERLYLDESHQSLNGGNSYMDRQYFAKSMEPHQSVDLHFPATFHESMTKPYINPFMGSSMFQSVPLTEQVPRPFGAATSSTLFQSNFIRGYLGKENVTQQQMTRQETSSSSSSSSQPIDIDYTRKKSSQHLSQSVLDNGTQTLQSSYYDEITKNPYI